MKLTIRLLILTLSFLYLGPGHSYGQDKSKKVQQADKYFEVEDYYLAADFYKEAWEEDSDNYYVAYKLAECYRQFFDYDRALEWYQKVVDNAKKKYPLAEFYHALMLKSNGEYEKARVEFADFISWYDEDDTYVKLAKIHMQGCEMALMELKKPQRDYVFENPGDPVNTGFSDFGAITYRHDSLIVVTSSRVEDQEKEQYRKLGGAYTDNYRFEKTDNGWNAFIKDDGFNALNSEHNDGAGVFSDNDKKYYYTMCGEEHEEDDSKLYICAIYVSKFTGYEWSEPKKLNENINTPGHWNAQPALSESGDTLFFASKRPGGFGMHDIWYSVDNGDDDWGQAVNMGSEINTPFIEMSPNYFSEENTLFFASNGHEGFGQLDIFMAKGKEYANIRNIGLPFNSNRDDFYFVMGEKKGYLSSNRGGGMGNDDIYSFNIESRESLIASIEMQDSLMDAQSITIRGRILDPEENPVEGVKVMLADAESNILKTASTDSNGEFVFSNLDPKKNYKVLLEEEDGRLTAEVNYLVDNIEVSKSIISPEVQKDEQTITYMKETGNVVLGRTLFENIYFDFDKHSIRPEAKRVLEELVEFYQTNPHIKIEIKAYTDSYGSPEYNVALSKRRGEAAKQYLLDNGVEKSSIIMNALGEGDPIATNKNPTGRQLNRRVEFVIVGGPKYEAPAMVYVKPPRTSLKNVADKFDMSMEEIKEMNNLQGAEDVKAYAPVRVRRLTDASIISPETMSLSGLPSEAEKTNALLSSPPEVYVPVNYQILDPTGNPKADRYNDGVIYGKSKDGIYTVLPKNTLFSISKIFEVNLDSLMQMNELESDLIYVGQQLKLRPDAVIDSADAYWTALPDAGYTVSKMRGETVNIGTDTRYVVKDGDTFYTVCKNFNMSFEELRQLNDMRDYLLRPGMVLKVDVSDKKVREDIEKIMEK